MRDSQDQRATGLGLQVVEDDDSSGRKAALIERYGITAETVDPSTLSKIMGINRKTLLGLATRGALPIKPKRVGRAMLFTLDDIVDWLTGQSHASHTEPPTPEKAAHGEVEVLPLELVAPIVQHAAATGPETPEQRVERISRQVLAKMNLSESNGRRKRKPARRPA